MQALNMNGILVSRNGKLSLKFGKDTTMEQVEKILSLYNEGGERDRLRLNTSVLEGIIIEFSKTDPIDPRSVALDLQEEGADIKIAPDVPLDEFLKAPVYVRRCAPVGWELGNCLPITTP